ncbi:MAG: hypothetical protein JWR26_1350 [Pedosphaera sp.]|nr:hypothetical protein [Pedosphaera sp.]
MNGIVHRTFMYRMQFTFADMRADGGRKASQERILR